MKLFWIGGVAEKDDFNEFLKNGNTQIAANVTQLNYIEGLEKASGETIKILNSHYEPSYPKYKKLFIKKRIWQRKGVENVDIGFFNVPILKYIHKTFKLRKELKKIIKNDFSDNELNVIFLYAMTTPLMLLAPFIKKKIKNKNFKIILVVPDLPEFMNMSKSGTLKEFLAKKSRKISYNCMEYIDKYILFAEPMAEYLKLKPEKYIVIEGMVNIDRCEEGKEAIKSNNQRPYIMYAGGVNEKYGVMNLVNAFHEIKNDNIELWLYGKGDAVEKIKELEKGDNRIKYKGIVNNEEIIRLEQNAKLLVNPRPTNEVYTKYSFPSKNMEYMLSGTPLLTTKLPAMPKEYNDYVYLFEDESINGFKNKLQYVLNLSDDILVKKGNDARNFVTKEKNNVIQAKKIMKGII